MSRSQRRNQQKRKREQEEEQKDGHTANRFELEDDTSIGLDSAEEFNERRRKEEKEDTVNR